MHTLYMEYSCESCNYTTKVNSNYNKHIRTSKHLLNFEKNKVKRLDQTEESIDKNTIDYTKSITSFSCKYCDKSFTFKQSMYRHMKNRCTKRDEEFDLKQLIQKLNLKLDSERKERDSETTDFYKQMEQQYHELEQKIRERDIQIETLLEKLDKECSFKNNTVNHYTLLVNESDVAGLSKSELIDYITKNTSLSEKNG